LLTILKYLRKALSVRIENTDFTAYFAFIESLPIVEVGHRHHILPRKEFPEFAKDPNNIARLSPADHFRAHYWLAVCASKFEMVFYLMANRKRVYQIAVDELPRYAEIYEKGRMVHTVWAEEFGRTYGQVNGERNVKSGLMARVGRVQGRKNVESGWLDHIRSHEDCIKGGIAAGRRAVESGQIQTLARSGIGGRKGGVTQGRRNAENGWFASIKTFQTCSKGGCLANHNRWHVKRNIMNPDCSLCEVV